VPGYREQVAALLGRLMLEHGAGLEASLGGFAAIVVVPSTDRPPPHPLITIARDTLEIDTPVRALLRRAGGDLGFRRASRNAYDVAEDSEPMRILLLDDVYTTGSRINSAAFALEQAGHTVAGALVLARRINTDYDDRAQALWDAQREIPFDWRTSPVIRGLRY